METVGSLTRDVPTNVATVVMVRITVMGTTRLSVVATGDDRANGCLMDGGCVKTLVIIVVWVWRLRNVLVLSILR